MRRSIIASLALALSLPIAAAQSIRLQLEGVPYSVASIDGSTNGKWLAIGSVEPNNEQGYLKLWNLNDNRAYVLHPERLRDLPVYDVSAVRFLPSREAFALIGVSSPLQVLEYQERGWNSGWFQTARFWQFGRALTVAPDLSAVVFTDPFGEIRLLQGFFTRVLARDQGLLAQVTYSANGALLATAGARAGGGSVRLWRTDNYTLLTELPTPSECTAVAFAPSGQYLAVGGTNGALRLYRLSDYAFVEVQAHALRVRALQFTPDSNQVVTGGEDGFVRVWAVPNLALQGEQATGYAVRSLFISPDGQALFTGGQEGQVDRWQLATLQRTRELTRNWTVHGFRRGTYEVWVSEATQTRVYDAQGQLVQQTPLQGIFSPDKQWVITLSGVVRVRDGQVVLPEVYQGVFSSDSRYLLVSEPSGTALYRTDTWTRLWRQPEYVNLLSTRLSRNGLRFGDHSAVYDTLTGAQLGRYTADIVALSDEGERVAILRANDTRTRIEMRRLPENTLLWEVEYRTPYSGEVADAVFAAQGHYLLVWTGDSIACFNAATGALVWDRPAPATQAEPRLLLTPDSYRLLVPESGFSNSFLVIPVAQPQRNQRLDAAPFGYAVTRAEFSDDGARLIAQASDSSVFVVATGLTTGDVDADGCVDDADLLRVLLEFSSNSSTADLNFDGVVDDIDLLLVLSSFGNGCTP